MSTSPTGGDWAKLRQVVIATSTHADDVATLRTSLGLGEHFGDPELSNHSLHDATFPISAERYLELVGPMADSGPVAAWLGKVGGRGGYVLSVQHPDPARVRERCAERGVRIAVDTQAFGRTIIQLHPKDVGLVLELDGIDEPDVWFWDDIDPGPAPTATVDEIVGVEVPVADPMATAALWAELLGIDVASADQVVLGGAWVRFVPGGPSANWTVVLRRANTDKEPHTDAAVPELAGITFRLA